jgi:hypothetical protein
MSGRAGEIITDIAEDGLYFHLDAANKASYPKNGTKAYNTIDPISGSFINDTFVDYSVGKGVFSFDGADDAIKLEGTDDANSWLIPADSTDPFSLSVWFNSNSVSTSQWLIASAQGGGTNWDVKIQSSQIKFRLRYIGVSPHYKDLISSTTLSNNTWYNTTAVFTGAQMILYINGVEDGTPISTTFYRATNSVDGSIGTYWYNGQPHSGDFNGEIGPISFYKSKALSAAEVLQNYNGLKERFGL